MSKYFLFFWSFKTKVSWTFLIENQDFRKVIFPEWNSYFRLKNMKFLSYPVFNWSNLTIHPYKIQFTNIKDKKNQLFLGYLDKLQTQRRTAIISFFV